MSRDEFLGVLAEFLHERTGLARSALTLDTDLVESRILDSFGVIELFFHMESLLGCSLDVSDFALDSVGTPRRIYDRYLTPSQ
ncbi:MAG TPA: phosphopantetheine-binding protein [Kofleriaceae bacterium]|nr:phosphopantetheine-binding protein [Kofleriaceae bacterium]